MRFTWMILLLCALLGLGGARTAYADPPDSSVKDKIGTAILRAAYGATVVVQAADASTTQQVIDMGGHELNPFLAPFAGSPAALYGVKAATALGFVLSEHSLARTHKFAAIAVAAAINGAFIMSARHNLQVIDQMRAQRAAVR